jgi:ubiquinone/menaquinone biosynthesis C-methylase UbiE
MFIFQPDRYFLSKFITTHASKFGGTVLDAGGGTRRYAKLFNHCDSFVILDIDPETEPDIVASVTKIPKEDNSFDGIICTQVLGDIPDAKDAISELIRVLKPGGLLLLSESLHNEQHDEPHDYRRFTEFAYQDLLDGDCDILTIETRGGLHSMIAQMKIRHKIKKWNLYKKPFIGRIANLWATTISKIAIFRDKKDLLRNKFTIGHCLLARKK